MHHPVVLRGHQPGHPVHHKGEGGLRAPLSLCDEGFSQQQQEKPGTSIETKAGKWKSSSIIAEFFFNCIFYVLFFT